tara:strand:+ start:795 stop:908 length:114 start_codon:yes stop_codon:yes gene_type:complete
MATPWPGFPNDDWYILGNERAMKGQLSEQLRPIEQAM